MSKDPPPIFPSDSNQLTKPWRWLKQRIAQVRAKPNRYFSEDSSASDDRTLLHKVRIDIHAEPRPRRHLNHTVVIASQARSLAMVRQLCVELFELVIRSRIRNRRNEVHHIYVAEAGR